MRFYVARWLAGMELLLSNQYQPTAKLRPLARSNPGLLVTHIAAYCSLPNWCLLLTQITVISVSISPTHYYHIDGSCIRKPLTSRYCCLLLPSPIAHGLGLEKNGKKYYWQVLLSGSLRWGGL